MQQKEKTMTINNKPFDAELPTMREGPV